MSTPSSGPQSQDEFWIDRLLRLYPSEYRERFAEGMKEMLLARLADARREGRVATAVFWMCSVRDAACIGLSEQSISMRTSLWRWIASVPQDLRYAVRSLGSQPVFTGMTLLALIVGIGVNTGLFTALNATLFRPWDVPDAKRVVHLRSLHPRVGYGGLPIASAAHFEANARTIEGAFAQVFSQMTLDDGPAERPVEVALVSRGYFDILGVGMRAGRSFIEGEDVPGAPAPVVVMSHGLWEDRYSADPDVVGGSVRIEGVTFTVVGIAGERFLGTGSGTTDLWVPLGSLLLLRPTNPSNLARLTDPEWCCYDVFARLSPGTGHDQAAAELSTLFRRFSVGAAQDSIGIAVIGTALFDHPDERPRVARILAISLSAFGAILLLSCANVSNMLLARGTARQREISVRLAIGASRGRVIRQLLTESLLLAGVAGGVSLLLAPVLPVLAMRLRGQRLPGNLDLTPDGTVLAYAVGISVLAALAFGLAPAMRSTRLSVGENLSGHSSRISRRFRLEGVLIGGQVAVSVALLMTAGLLLRGLDRAASLDLGFRTDGVSAVSVLLPRNRYDPAGERAFFDELLQRFQSGGVQVGMTSLVPLGNARNFTDFVVPGAAMDPAPLMPVHDVAAGYFDVLEIPISVGRSFRPDDRELGAIIVNESLARAYWPDGSAVSRSVTIGDRQREIVGVVPDAQLDGVGSRGPMYFSPFTANSQGVGVPPVILVTSDGAASVVAAVRAAESDATIETIPLSEQADRSLGGARGAARIAAVLAWVALLLATSGVYGVISYSVEQRRREIGTRIALGARPREVVGLVLRRTGRPVAIGLAAGLLISAGASWALRSQLYGLNPLDPTAVAGVVTILVLAGAAACVIPARRAVRVDPVATLGEG